MSRIGRPGLAGGEEVTYQTDGFGDLSYKQLKSGVIVNLVKYQSLSCV